MINVAPSALKKINLQAAGSPYLRVGLKAWGCMGITQFFDFCEDKKDSDIVMEFDGIIVLIDPKSAGKLDGATLRWSRNLLKSELVWDLPEQQRRCSCGISIAL